MLRQMSSVDSSTMDLDQLTSLAGLMTSGPRLLGLYFAASWCPDCTPVTALLKRAYERQAEKSVEILYVSSDLSASQMTSSMKTSHGDWLSIPFDDIEERRNLKRYFKAFAGKEASELGISMSNRRPIPCLVLLDCKNHRILTYDGVSDFSTSGSESDDAFQKWLKRVKDSS